MAEFDDLARRLWPALSFYLHDRDSSLFLGVGSSFPTAGTLVAGLQAGQRYFRSDLGLACYYDGTRWLTVNEYTCELTTSEAQAASFAGTTVNVRNGIVRNDYTIQFTRAQADIFCGATNNAANYFTYAFKNDAASVTFFSFTTAGDTANANNLHTVTSFTQPGSAFNYLRLDMTVSAGAPSAQFPRAPVVWYRLVIP